MSDVPTLWVCHGDDGGPKFHPCRVVQTEMKAKGIAFEKVIGGHGNPVPFLQKRHLREDLFAATGGRNLPTLQLPDGTSLKGSRAIRKWIAAQPSAS